MTGEKIGAALVLVIILIVAGVQVWNGARCWQRGGSLAQGLTVFFVCVEPRP